MTSIKTVNGILPLPVKKNKFGERVADISIAEYYRQICEEVLEAHAASIEIQARDYDSLLDIADNEPMELVDVITCCITRLEIMHWYEDGDDFGEYVDSIIYENQLNYKEPADFYADLSAAVMQSYHAARTGKIIDYLHKEGCGSCAADLDVSYCDEEGWLGDIMVMCIKRLEQLGYDESARQEIYQAVNAKNRKRGYFEE